MLPVESLGGVARILRNFDGFKRMTDTIDSPNLGLNFCTGCWSEMGGQIGACRQIHDQLARNRLPGAAVNGVAVGQAAGDGQFPFIRQVDHDIFPGNAKDHVERMRRLRFDQTGQWPRSHQRGGL